MADDSMLQEHRKTYEGFVRLLTVSSALVALTLVLMAIFVL